MSTMDDELEAIYPRDDFINDLLLNTPESWDGEGSVESVAVDYVRTLEDRVLALGGSLERWPNEESGDASVTPSLTLIMAWRLYINDHGVVTCAHDDWDPSSVGRRCRFQDMADALIAHIVTDHNGQMP